MQEREIFLSALEINDPVARQEHVQSACAGNDEMLARVMALLGSHEGESEFLKTPVAEQLADDSTRVMESEQGSFANLPINKESSALPADAGTLPHTLPYSANGSELSEKMNNLNEGIKLGFLQPSTRPDSLGKLGHYEILEVLGRGAFGIVLKAFDEKLLRVVAIKVLAPEMSVTSPARKRFLREARSSAAIRQENVVNIYAVEDNPIPFIVMEFIPGRNLQERLNEQGPLDLLDVLRLGKQIADGLAAAHAEQLIHRDIKPGNILLETNINERVKITDFGLARTVDDATMTQSGMIAGTPMYMSPEQALGHKIDQRADLFSLGSVLYEMLSGRPPFRAPNTMAVLKRVTEDSPRPIKEIIPEVPEWMCQIIKYLHAKNPEKRYQSAREVSEVLAQCLAELQAGREPMISTPSQTADKKGPDVSAPKPKMKKTGVGRPLVHVMGLGLLALLGMIVLEMNGVMHLSSFFQKGEPIEFPPNPKKSAITPIQNPHAKKPIEWPKDAPALAVAPFNADQAKKYQEAWAKYLGVPVEKEILLGRDKLGLDVKLIMVLIPPGEFLMGSSEEEIKKLREQASANGLRQSDLKWIDLEGPRRKVLITRPYYLGRTEFSTEQFRRFMVANPNFKTDDEKNGGSFMPAGKRDPMKNWEFAGKYRQGPESPVVNVSWNDAMMCCDWLSKKDGNLTFALPTEAQWEYACRGGTTTAWCCGDDKSKLGDYSWYRNKWPRHVGKMLPNAFGLHDMHGNVWECCWDSFYNYRDAGNVDPVGPTNGDRRIIRGGNSFEGYGDATDWNNQSGFRSASRLQRMPDRGFLDRGFRVMAYLPEAVMQAKGSEVQPVVGHFKSGEWIEVIPLINPELDKLDMPNLTDKNEWKVKGGELLVGHADLRPHKLILPLDSAWSSYECELEVTRRAGTFGFCLNLPSVAGDCPVVFDWPNRPGHFIGSSAKGAQVAKAPAFETGKRIMFRIEVRRQDGDDHVKFWRNGTFLGKWTGDRSKVTTRLDKRYPPDRRTSLYVWGGGSQFVFHRIRIRMLDGGVAETLRPVPELKHSKGAEGPQPSNTSFNASQANQRGE